MAKGKFILIYPEINNIWRMLMISRNMFRKNWEDLKFSDGYIFYEVMENKELFKELLEILLHVKIHHLEKRPVIGQSIQSGGNFSGIGVDVYLQDSNRVLNIEMQIGEYMSMIVEAMFYKDKMNLIEIARPTECKEQKEKYVIFIGNDDCSNLGKSVCTENTFFTEGLDCNSKYETHFIFYNASKYEMEKDKEVQSVLKFIYGLKAETPFTNKLQTAFNEIKQNQIQKMLYMDCFDYISEENDEAALETSVKIAYSMIEDGVPIANIVKYTHLETEVVEDMVKEVKEKVE